MLSGALARVLEREGRAGVRYLTPVSSPQARDLVARTYSQIRDDYIVGPPFTLHSVIPELLVAVWNCFRESLVVGNTSRVAKEAVATAVSRSNQSRYCVDAHGLSVQAEAGPELAEAIERGHLDDITDPEMRGLVEWAEALRVPGAEVLARPPFTREQAPELIGTAVFFHYLNRMVNVFCYDEPIRLPWAMSGLRVVLRLMAAPMLRPRLRQSRVSRYVGPSVRPKLPADLSWAGSNPAIAEAFAELAEVTQQWAKVVLPDGVRRVVEETVDGWRGEDPGLGRHWLEEAVDPVDDADRPAARLALLMALASYGVGEHDIQQFRDWRAGDQPLLAVAAWASFTAARKIGSWVCVP